MDQLCEIKSKEESGPIKEEIIEKGDEGKEVEEKEVEEKEVKEKKLSNAEVKSEEKEKEHQDSTVDHKPEAKKKEGDFLLMSQPGSVS